MVAGVRAARPPGLAAAPGSRPGPGCRSAAYTDADDCDTDLPFIGDAVDAVCDVGSWLGDHAGAAVDAGVDFLDTSTDLASDALAGLSAAAHDSVSAMRSLAAVAASALAHTAGRAGRARPRRYRPTLRRTPSTPTAATHPKPTAPVAPRTA